MNKLMKKRRERIAATIKAYGVTIWGKEQAKYEPEDQTISDLLADLMHYCHLSNLDFGHLLLSAEGNFNAETGPGDDIEQDARRLEEQAG